jgi:hypothetical protein
MRLQIDFAINKSVEIPHVFFVFELIRTFSRGRSTNGKVCDEEGGPQGQGSGEA